MIKVLITAFVDFKHNHHILLIILIIMMMIKFIKMNAMMMVFFNIGFKNLKHN